LQRRVAPCAWDDRGQEVKAQTDWDTMAATCDRQGVRESHAMLTFEDCIAFCGMDADEVEALAVSEHLPTVIAAEWTARELGTAEGRTHVIEILSERAGEARLRGDFAAADELERILERERARL